MFRVSPFVPMVFQGEEWAASTPFCYFAELESEHANDANWEHAPDPTDPATRTASVLRWDERALPPHAEMLAWYRELIALRRAHPNLRDPSPSSTIVTTERDGHLLHIGRGAHTTPPSPAHSSPASLTTSCGSLLRATPASR